MATSHITPFPSVPPVPFMPPLPNGEELQKLIKSTVENTIIDVMNNPGSELGGIIKKHVKESMECEDMMKKLAKKVHHYNVGDDDGDDDKVEVHSDLETLFCTVNDYHTHMHHHGKSLMDIEHEISSQHPDMSAEESRVLSCLLRTDGPVRLSSMIGMNVDEFIEHMKHLGKRFNG